MEVITKMQLLLENMDGTVDWPISVFMDGIWLKLNKSQKLEILDMIERGCFSREVKESEQEEGSKKLKSGKQFSRIC